MSTDLSEFKQEACDAAKEADDILNSLNAGIGEVDGNLDNASPGQVLYQCAEAANNYHNVMQKFISHKNALAEECKICEDAYNRYNDMKRKANLSFKNAFQDFDSFSNAKKGICFSDDEEQNNKILTILKLIGIGFVGFFFGYYFFSYRKNPFAYRYNSRKRFCMNEDIF